MKKRRISKAAKRRLFILVPITVIFVAYFLLSFSYYAFKIYQLKQEQRNLQAELNNLKEEENDLKIDIEKLQNPDYLARYARENYHYSKEGELVIQRYDKEEKEEEVTKENNTNETIMTICIIGLIIVAFYIFRRKQKKDD